MTNRIDQHARINRCSLLACGIMTLALVVMLLRVAQLEIVPSPRLADHVQERVTRATLPGVRGEILDRRGRLLSTTRIGYRVFVDPTRFPNPPEQAIASLADAIGIMPEQVGEPIMSKVAINDAREQLSPSTDQQAEPKLSALLARYFDSGHEATSPEQTDQPTLVRYVPVGPVLSDSQIAAVKALKLPGVHLERRDIREYPAGPLIASVVGKVGDEPKWSIGAERILDHELLGTSGKAEYVRDAQGRPLWVEPGRWNPAKRGEDARLSLDLELQRIAHEELMRGIEEANAAGGRCIMLDPLTGEVLAMVDIVRDLPDLSPFRWEPMDPKAPRPPAAPTGSARPRYRTLSEDAGRKVHPALARNRCIEDVYEPGSTFKAFVWSVITERGLAKPDETFDTEGGRWFTAYGRFVEDVTKRDIMTWREVLVNSSNIGMVKASERLTSDQLHEAVVRFGFGKRTNIGLPGEGAGIVTPMKRWSKYTQTSVPIGHEVAVTPIQMVRAFSTFARPGDLAGTMPEVTLRAVDTDEMTMPVVNRVLPTQIATIARETLAGVTHNVEERMKLTRRLEGETAEGAASEAHPWRYTLFGKSGTAEIPLGKAPTGMRRPRGSSGYYDNQYNSSFIAGGPIEDPRLVCLVVIDDPGPDRVRARTHYGSMTAGPVVRRAMERALTYLGTPPSLVAEPALVKSGE